MRLRSTANKSAPVVHKSEPTVSGLAPVVPKDSGVIYVAYGSKAIDMAKKSIEILRYFNNKIPVSVISDQEIEDVNNIYHEDTDSGARFIKTSIYFLSPYKRTLYLDADTELKSDPTSYFSLLDKVDLVMGQDVTRIFNKTTHPHLVQEEVEATIEETDGGEFIQYNTGVIFFRKCDAVEKLMRAWHEEWKRWKRQDQPAMFRAMYRHPVRIAPMREPFNTHHSAKAKVVFHAHRRASREGSPK